MTTGRDIEAPRQETSGREVVPIYVTSHLIQRWNKLQELIEIINVRWPK